MTLTSWAYRILRASRDINAIQKGKVSQRIKRRLAGKIAGRILGRI